MKQERKRATNQPTKSEKFVEVESPDDFHYEGQQVKKTAKETRQEK